MSKISWQYYNMNNQSDVFNNVKEAIDNAIKNIIMVDGSEKNIYKINNKMYIDILINFFEPYNDRIYASYIIDHMRSLAKSKYENLDDYLLDVDTQWLQSQLDIVWNNWKRKEKISVPFYNLVKTKKYQVEFKRDKVISYKEVK